MTNYITTETLVSDGRFTLNAVIKVSIRTLIHTEEGLIQPSTTDTELTLDGARQLVEMLTHAIRLEETLTEPSYLIQPTTLSVDGTDYDTWSDYLIGNPSEN